MADLLEIQNLTKFYQAPAGGKTLVLENISFSIPQNQKGSIIAILGSFGSGKSTLMKIAAGLEDFEEGNLLLNGNSYHNITGGRIIYLPENPVSFPWLSVKGNIEMALKLPQNKKKFSAEEIISLIGLSGYENSFPDNGSIGFRFRISLGRALAVDPDIILIDDSFRLMDVVTRGEIYEMVKKVNSETGKTIITATTNITEAVLLPGRIIFIRKNPGRIYYDMMLVPNITKTDEYVIRTRMEIEEIIKRENPDHTLQMTI